MDKLNVEIQINGFSLKKANDPDIRSQHMAIYFVLIQKWTQQKDNPVIIIKSHEIMKAAGIGSKNSYFRYIRDLDDKEYLSYKIRGKEAHVTMHYFYPSTTTGIPDMGHSYLNKINIDKNDKIDQINPVSAPVQIETVEKLFLSRGLTKHDAKKWYDFYVRNKWKTKDGFPVQNWEFLALRSIENKLKTKKNTNNDTKNDSYTDPI